ncbi:mitochondrial import receptor subunit TOM22 homolog [Perognathus longimembris pacificus]|uniref:mitochondrial import receptor subunit TOM22 homolog n=1 Tax=Perognathus longimembris pacificus TaxID=214514 RepID=UPI002018C59C|nr:mitochondrial import receptor subunit TOM22 homolog [Perognathus longimembris pacificus]
MAAAATGGAGEPVSVDELLPELLPSDELDETLSERLWGLTEMFPERIQSTAGATFDLSLFVAQKIFSSRVRAAPKAVNPHSTSMILVLPVVFETEKLQMEQQQQLQQQLQQRQILLGPNTGAVRRNARSPTFTSWKNLDCYI